MTLRTLFAFLLMAFAIAWGIIGLYIFASERMVSIFGALTGRHPLFYLAVYAPAIAAVVIVSLGAGLRGLQGFMRRLLMWRAPAGWYGLIVFIVPMVFYAAAAAQGRPLAPSSPFDSLPAYLSAAFFMAIKGPVEEIGWRGLALPLLQRRFTPLSAGLILGVIWGVWHLPAFLLSGTPQSEWTFLPFLIGSIALSVIVTPMFNAARGSILLPAVFHFQLINPLWPDAQPLDTYLFVAVAVAVVWLNRRTMFSKTTAVTEVIPGQGP